MKFTESHIFAKERHWKFIDFIAIEDIYSIRLFEGQDTGVECYVVMMGGEILSAHETEDEAIEQFNARLNDEVSGENDGWGFDDF